MTSLIDVLQPRIAAGVADHVTEWAELSPDDISRFHAIDYTSTEWAGRDHLGQGLALGHDPLDPDQHTNPDHFTMRFSSPVIADRINQALLTPDGAAISKDLAVQTYTPVNDLAGAYLEGMRFVWNLTILRWDHRLPIAAQSEFGHAALASRSPSHAELLAWVDYYFHWTPTIPTITG